jgi:hypothetical protein
MSIFEQHEKFEQSDTTSVSDNENAPAFFDLKKVGDSAVVAFLDPDDSVPVLVKLHKVFGYNEGENYPSWVVDPTSLGQTNHLQEYLDKNVEKTSRDYGQLTSERYYCFTVLREGNQKDDGTRYPAYRQIRLTKKTQAKAYGSRCQEVIDADRGAMKDLSGLHGNWFYLNRPDEDFVPRIGLIGDFIEEFDGELPLAFTPEEIQSRLVISEDGLKEFTERHFNASSGGSTPKTANNEVSSEFVSDDIPF